MTNPAMPSELKQKEQVCKFCGQGESGGPLYLRGNFDEQKIHHHWICLVEWQDKEIHRLTRPISPELEAADRLADSMDVILKARTHTPICNAVQDGDECDCGIDSAYYATLKFRQLRSKT